MGIVHAHAICHLLFASSMQLFHLYHNHAFPKAIHGDFRNFELSVWLHTVARSLISVFVPILLLELGYDVRAVIWYYVALNIVDVPANFFAEHMTVRYGSKRVIVAATLVSIAYFWILGAAELGAGWTTLLVLAALDALYDVLYYVSHLYLFMKSSSGSTSRATGTLTSIRTLGSMCGPLVGAALFVFGARNALFTASIAFFALSLFPLLSLKHAADAPPLHRTSIRDIFRHAPDRRNFLSLALRAIQNSAENILWPLFIYSLFRTDSSVAWIAVIVSLSKVVFSYFTGSIRRKNRPLAMLAGGSVVGLIWVLRLFLEQQSFYYASIVLIGFFALLVDIPNDTAIFERGRAGDSLRYSTLRNAVSMGGHLVFFLLLAFLAEIFRGSFVIAALCGFGVALIAGMGRYVMQKGR